MGIQQLLQAEKEAENLIANAKKNCSAKLKQAKEKAEEELKIFREEQEKKFQKEMGAKAASDQSKDLQGVTEQEIAKVKKDYQQNKERTVKYVFDKVFDVPTQ